MESKNYLFDITTIITFISDITNDLLISDKIKDKKIEKHDLILQIKEEQANPILPKLQDIMNNNKVYVTKNSLTRTIDIIKFSGSSDENKRMTEFTNKVTVIPDDPGDKFKNLTGKIWTDINKNVFGTADKHKLILLTGNLRCVNFVKNEMECAIEIVLHKSRCFVGDNL